ncbi:MAG: hypothetical protein WCJ30_23880, partial [Deltaproteobacteria bacterium]
MTRRFVGAAAGVKAGEIAGTSATLAARGGTAFRSFLEPLILHTASARSITVRRCRTPDVGQSRLTYAFSPLRWMNGSRRSPA